MSEAIVDVSVSYSDDSENGKEFVYGKRIGELVRCKDCRWWCTDCMPDEFGWCDARMNKATDEDWFCADGERKDDA